MAGANTLEFNDTNFETEVLEAQQPVIVDFWAEWCGPCKALGPVIDGLASDYVGRAKVGKCDIESNSSVSARYGIASIPTVLVFKGGEIKQRFVGIKAKADFASAIDALL